MRKHLQKGSSTSEGLWILAGLALIFFFFILPGDGIDGPIIPSETNGQVTQSTTISSAGAHTTAGRPILATNPNSSYSKLISLGRGNASYATQSYDEYITISNYGRAPVDITGWRLANAKSERPYDYGGMLRYFPSDSVAIPRASLYLYPSRANQEQNVILESGEMAIVTTGKVGASTPYRITSFKENICTGYLEELPEYNFNPPLSRSCPEPRNEPGLNSLDPKCRDFIKNLNSCRVPEFETKDANGETCHNCVNGVQLSSSCIAFIEERFSYAGCLAHHSNDPEFSGRTWRIFLGQGWEMWAESYETISLYDRLGNLVDSISY